MGKATLTDAERAAYRELARAAAKLRRAQAYARKRRWKQRPAKGVTGE